MRPTFRESSSPARPRRLGGNAGTPVARDLKRAGFRVLLAEDASAGIDVPAAGLYQEKAKQEGTALGVEYVPAAALGPPGEPAA